MSRRGWVALGVGAVLVLVGWKSIETWRESADRAALRAEILARLEARSPTPPADDGPIPEEENGAADYLRAVRGAAGNNLPPAIWRAMQENSWAAPPEGLEKALKDAAHLLDAIDAGARRPKCRFPPGEPGWMRAMYVLRLVEARGRLAATKGEFAAAIADLSLLRRLAREAVASTTAGTFSSRSVSYAFQCYALNVLREIALRPDLDEAGARAALAAAKGPWSFQQDTQAMCETFPDGTLQYMASLLGPDAKDVMKEAGLPVNSLERTFEGMFGGATADVRPRSPPSAADVRRALAAQARAVEAVRRWDLVALAPGGPVWEAEQGTEGDPWPPHRFGISNAWMVWWRVRQEAEVEAARGVLAARIFELREGKPPARWEEIAPSLLAEPPADPYTGGVLLLEVLPGGGAVSARAWRGTFVVGEPTNTMTLEPVRLEWKRSSK